MKEFKMKNIYENKLSKHDVYSKLKFERDFPILVRTVKGETRSGKAPEMINVAFTILNRVQKKREVWGMNVSQVCLKANSKGVHQYSYWDKTNLKYFSYFYVRQIIGTIMVAIEIWNEGNDLTYGATHYHTHDTHPDWAVGHTPCTQDDMHLFYNDIY